MSPARRVPGDQVEKVRDEARKAECPECGASARSVKVWTNESGWKPAVLCRECRCFWEPS